MILITIISAILIFVIITFSLRSAEIDKFKISLEAGKLCTLAKNSVNQVSSSGQGSRAEITLPERLVALNYQMTVYASDKKIILSWGNSSVVCGVLTPNVTNSTNSVFDFYKGRNVLRNDDNTVVVSSS